MKDACYMVLSEYGIQRMTKRPGVLKRGEVSVCVHITVPDTCFYDPAVSVSIDIPESAVIHPTVEIEVAHPAEDTQS